MTKQLYEEALADVKKLKEVAEDNAKRALLEAVTPRIRDLIENQLMGQLPADEEDLLMDDPQEDLGMSPANPVPAVGDSSAAAAAMSMPDEEGKVTLDLDALKVPGTDEYELSMESAKALGVLVNGNANRLSVQERVKILGSKVKKISEASKIVKESAGYADALASIILEIEDTYSHLQEKALPSSLKNSLENLLETYHITLKRLTEQKMKNRNRLSEADVTLKLTGLPDEVDLDSVGVDLITGEDEGGEEGEEEGGDDLDLGDEEGGEEGEEEGGDDLDLDLGDEEGSEESDDSEEEKMESRRLSDDTIVEIDEGMLRREIAKMKALREADETKPQSWGHGAGDVSDEFEDDDMGDPFVDVDLTTEADEDKKDEAKDMDELDEADMDEADMDQVDEADMDEADEDKKEEAKDMDELDEYGMDEADMEEAEDTEEYGGVRDEAQTNKQSRQPGATVESLRRRLAAEARLQTEAKKKAQQAKKMQGKKQQEAQQSKKQAKQKMKEAQEQAKQGKKVQAQQNKKVAQKKAQEAQQKQKQAKKMQEAYAYYATKFNESVARSRRLQGLLSEAVSKGRSINESSTRSAAETNNLRTKLAETNLFNAKLLFTNKLLQNESLTKRQKAEVIERLDEAKSEREVKLVYESLVKTLAGSTRSAVNESTNRAVIGSSSRPARPAAATNTLNEGFEADRWAKLAGIVK